jgi:hypothetical protein
MAPRLTPFFFAVIGIALIGAALRRGTDWRQLLPRRHALAVCLLLAAYVFLNATWSADRADGFGKAAMLAGLGSISFAAVAAALALDQRILIRAGLFFAAGAFIGGLFIMIELLTDGILTRIVMNSVPALHPSSPKGLKILHGQVIGINLSQLNLNVNLAMFHLWPGMLALMRLEGTRRTAAMAIFFVVLAAVVAISKHDSSQIALVGSSLVVLLAWNCRRAVIRALAVLWCVAFVLVIPASFIAYQGGLHLAIWLPKSARDRIIIWEYTAEQTLTHPLLGVGVKSTPALRDQQKATASLEQPEGFVGPRTVGHHAHNIFLQAFLELGAVGAFLLVFAGVAVAMLIFLLPASAQPFAAGAFAAFALVATFAWGMWQSWFMCAAGLLPLYLRVAAAACEARENASCIDRMSSFVGSTRPKMDPLILS